MTEYLFSAAPIVKRFGSREWIQLDRVANVCVW